MGQADLEDLGEGAGILDCHFKKVILASLEIDPKRARMEKGRSYRVMAIIQERNHVALDKKSSGDSEKRSDFTYLLTEFAHGLDVGCKKTEGLLQGFWFSQLEERCSHTLRCRRPKESFICF